MIKLYHLVYKGQVMRQETRLGTSRTDFYNTDSSGSTPQSPGIFYTSEHLPLYLQSFTFKVCPQFI